MTTTATTAPANPDSTPVATQPIGYWSTAASKAVLQHIQSAMARLDITQPHWWVINHVSGADEGLTRDELRVRLGGFVDNGEEMVGRAADGLLARGWLTADAAERLRLTDTGREARGRIKKLVDGLRAEIHEGIPNEEYVIALSVLQRMIRNVEAKAAQA
ncbi:MarR family winged helix-turn-helix transcriptional regulator [Streptomyces syringium]|uniref:MarR family winged helix-turn-helix transcriptional regulator n=1 Tax=Streptomyces syringium TaxID=76729 RepID=UPI003D8DB22A